MLKKLGILLLGIICGVAVMYFLFPRNETPAEFQSQQTIRSGVNVPPVDYDTLYDKLLEEKRGEPDEKYWFDKQVEEMDTEAKKRTEKMQSAGDDAAKAFEEFAKPEDREKP